MTDAFVVTVGHNWPARQNLARSAGGTAHRNLGDARHCAARLRPALSDPRHPHAMSKSDDDPSSAAGSPPPPPKRRKVEDSSSSSPPNGADAADRDPSPPSPPPPPPPTRAETSTHPDPAPPNGSDKSSPPRDKEEAPPQEADDAVPRGPRVAEIGDLDGVRPPRRPENKDPPADDREPHASSGGGPHGLAAAPPPPASNYPSTSTGVAPEVDDVLQRIFASGLFEQRDIDGRALDLLGSVSTQLALAALEDIQRRDFSTVRNKPAFIMSIFKRVIAGGGSIHPPPGPPPGGFPPTSVPASALAHLPPAVSDALQRVFTSGVCHPSQFDDRAMDILVDLAEPDAVRALSEFAAMEPGRVRNPSAFWMGLARKYKGHSRAPGGRMGPDSVPGGYGSGFDTPGGYGRGGGSTGGYSALEQRLDELANAGTLPRNVLDDRALEALRRLPEQDGLDVLAELPEPARVRNMSAYVMGLCKKFANGEARSLSQRGNPYGGGGAYGGTYGPSYGASGGYGAPYGAGGYGAPPPAYGGGYGAPPTAASYAPSPYGAPPGPMGGYGSAPPPQADPNRSREVHESIEGLDPSVRDRFQSMTDRGIISETTFDARAIGALHSMRSEEACAALDELAASDPGRIHNISAYFMGLAKKFSRPAL